MPKFSSPQDSRFKDFWNQLKSVVKIGLKQKDKEESQMEAHFEQLTGLRVPNADFS
jgi:hypothetical protein